VDLNVASRRKTGVFTLGQEEKSCCGSELGTGKEVRKGKGRHCLKKLLCSRREGRGRVGRAIPQTARFQLVSIGRKRGKPATFIWRSKMHFLEAGELNKQKGKRREKRMSKPTECNGVTQINVLGPASDHEKKTKKKRGNCKRALLFQTKKTKKRLAVRKSFEKEGECKKGKKEASKGPKGRTDEVQKENGT